MQLAWLGIFSYKLVGVVVGDFVLLQVELLNRILFGSGGGGGVDESVSEISDSLQFSNNNLLGGFLLRTIKSSFSLCETLLSFSNFLSFSIAFSYVPRINDC